MNKSKIILASVGGVTLLVSLALAYFIWSALSEKGERSDELDGAIRAAVELSNLPIYPGPDGIQAYKTNAEAYVEWREEAMKVVTIGDIPSNTTTPPAMKARFVEESRRLALLPGGVEGRIVKPDFPFGFREFVIEDKLPAQEDIARLQREWFDVSTVVKELSASGVIEITDITVVASAPAAEEPQREGRQRKKGAKKQVKKDVSTDEAGPAVTRMRVDFLTKPQGLVAVANALMKSKRFIVVDDFSFTHERDIIAEKIGGEQNKASEAQAGRGGRRGRRAQQEEPAEDSAAAEAQTGVVTDPQTAPALKVSMSISVYDFRSLYGEKAESETEEQK